MGYVEIPRTSALTWQAAAAAVGVDAEKLRLDTQAYHVQYSLKGLTPAEATPEDLDLSAFSFVWKLVGADVKLWINDPICPPCPKIEPVIVPETIPAPVPEMPKTDAGAPETADAGTADLAPEDVPARPKKGIGKKPGRSVPKPKPQDNPKEWKPIQ